MSDDKYFTQLDMELQQLALVDWAAFSKLVGEEAITAAKVCLLKSRGKSLAQISNRLDITKRQVQTRCEKCDNQLHAD